jgi:hypothetical protein
MPIAYPKTDSGVELRILKHLFTPDETEIALNLSALTESADKIYKRAKKNGISREKVEKILNGLVENGFIAGGKLLKAKGEEKYYIKAPLAIGMYEFQVNRLTEEFCEDMKQYENECFAEAFITPKTSQMKTIPSKAVSRRNIMQLHTMMSERL